MTQTQLQTEPSESPCSVEGIQIPPEGVYDAAPRVWSFIERALATPGALGLETPADILQMASKNSLQIWLAYAPDDDEILGVVVTEVLVYDQGSVCNTLLASGHDVRRWAPMWATLEAWAKREGATKMQISGRAGWSKVPGFREAYRVFVKEI